MKNTKYVLGLLYKLKPLIFNRFFSNKVLIILYIIFSTSVFVNSVSPNELDYIKLEITNEITFDTTIDEDFSISKFDLFSYFLPVSYGGSQYLNEFDSDFENKELIVTEGSNYVRFDFKDNLNLFNVIKNKFILESTVTKPKVIQKNIYPIPITKIEDKYLIYLEFNGLVNLNDKIKNQASTLATGEDDVFVIATKVANWITKDITYDLTSVLENPDQTSTDVFNSKEGVCKEITNLFTSMMRSLGIPTRFVTGYAYTNSEELTEYLGSNWGGHVWSEVLIGDIWVPFDLTYNQYGFVDATHIITDKSQFIRNNGISLDAYSYGIRIVPNSLSLKNEFKIIEDREKLFDTGFDIELSGPDKLSFGSLGYVTAKIINKMPYYQNIFINFAKADVIEYLNENNVENIYMFKPYEEQELTFKYKIPNDLDENYKYTFPFLVYNNFFEKSLKIEVANTFQFYNEIKLPEEKTKQIFYTDNNLYYKCDYELGLDVDNLEIICIIQNPNNFEINELQVCVSQTCKNLNLKVNELVTLTFQTLKKETQLFSNYDGNSEKINLNFKYPQLVLSHNAIYEDLKINLQTITYINNLKLEILINDEIIFDEKISEFEVLDLTPKPGEQNLKFKLYHGEIIFDQIEKNIFIEKTPFFIAIKQWFDRNLFEN